MTRMRPLTLEEWDRRYDLLMEQGLREPAYGGPIRRHLHDGDTRLRHLRFDGSPEALRLWNFLLTEEDRLAEARRSGKQLLGTMKDLGTVPVLAYGFDNLIPFYPDGAWWIPCVMELGAGLLEVADSLGVGEGFCPVRAMLGAFVTEAHFPIPDGLVCSVGATCDDFSAIAMRLQGLGHPVEWWEIPHRREPASGEPAVALPGGVLAPLAQVRFVEGELARIAVVLEQLTGQRLSDEKLADAVRTANGVRRCLTALRDRVYTAPVCPMPALEMLIAEMLAIHYCSDRLETLRVLEALLRRVESRVEEGEGYLGEDAVRIFWVNPVADLGAMNLLEECGGRIAGTEYLFPHALDPIPEDVLPMEALARTALADPMVGPAGDRAHRIVADMRRYGAEAVVVSRIPGASHCATEGEILARELEERYEVPVLEIEVPPLTDAVRAALTTRMQALVETVRQTGHKQDRQGDGKESA